MGVLTMIYPLYNQSRLYLGRIVQQFQGLGINGHNGDRGIMANKITRHQDTNETTPTRTKTHNHYNKYTIYPLYYYVIDIVMFFGFISWSNYGTDSITMEGSL